MPKPKFVRQEWNKKIKLGKASKKKRKWRKPKGIDSKIRLKEKGYRRMPRVGWGGVRGEKGKIKGMDFERIENLKELKNFKGKVILIGKVGVKKRKEIIKKAEEMKIKILNKYLKKLEPKVEGGEDKKGDEKSGKGDEKSENKQGEVKDATK